jgi:ABC-type nickel/cobalt efflux system permease component RcnA
MLKKIHQNAIFFLFFGLFLFLFTSENASAAGLVPCGLGATDPCTLCHFIVGIKGLIDWGMGILVAISITAISIAGVMYVISSGDPTFAKKAKDFVTSVVIGFALMLGAWLIVNTTFYLFSAKKDATSGTYNLGLTSKSWNSFSCSTVSTTMGTLPMTGEAPISGYDCSSLSASLQTDKTRKQCTDGDASTSLQTLIVCMRNKLGSKMIITSISDDAGLSSCQASWAQPPCAHEKSSCHYGGTAGGKSEAIDVSTTSGLTVDNITTAAKECGIPTSAIKDESNKNHVHVSTTSCNRAN